LFKVFTTYPPVEEGRAVYLWAGVVGSRMKEVSKWLTKSVTNASIVGLVPPSARWKRLVKVRINTRLIRKNVSSVALAPMFVR